MGVRGKKPKPTALKLLEGNPGKRRLNSQEPRVAVSMPKPPKHLTQGALNEWKRVAKILHAVGVLSVIDRAVLAGYCQSYARWAEAEQKLKDHGLLIKSKSPNNFPMQSPYLAIANKALAQMMSLAAELGLTPSSRVRIHANPERTKTQPAEPERPRQGFFEGRTRTTA
jgi:P27 family predicted phage terminase small subunit